MVMYPNAEETGSDPVNVSVRDRSSLLELDELYGDVPQCRGSKFKPCHSVGANPTVATMRKLSGLTTVRYSERH